MLTPTTLRSFFSFDSVGEAQAMSCFIFKLSCERMGLTLVSLTAPLLVAIISIAFLD